jgi:putative transcriptional regulator
MTAKRTLKNHGTPAKPAPTLTAAELVAIRNSMNLSRGLFARRLRLPVRALEGYEQGRAAIPPAVALLVLLVRDYPDTVQRLATI